MPILIREIEWNQTESLISFSVPLKGGTRISDVDILATKDYIKLSYPPYLFENFFFAPVKQEGMKCVLSESVMNFQIEKQVPGEWSKFGLTLR